MNNSQSIRLLTIAFLLLGGLSISGQGVYIGTSLHDADSTALVEAESSTKGVLIPRMSNASMLAIEDPEEGLMVFSTTESAICYYNGSAWSSPAGEEIVLTNLGEPLFGGVVISVDETGSHGVVAATQNLSKSTYTWGIEGILVGADSEKNGSANSKAILNSNKKKDIAASVAASFSQTADGETYGEWHLPSIEELQAMQDHAQSIKGIKKGNFRYWSSTESSPDNAKSFSFKNGSTEDSPKESELLVIPVKSF